MRISKSQIRARTRDLPITFSSERISAHGGLEIVRRFFELIDLRALVRDRMRGVGREGGRWSLDFFSETQNICIKLTEDPQ